jgi:hypothetical protein
VGKRAGNDMAKFRLAFWFFLGALIFIIAGIPWALERPWVAIGVLVPAFSSAGHDGTPIYF